MVSSMEWEAASSSEGGVALAAPVGPTGRALDAGQSRPTLPQREPQRMVVRASGNTQGPALRSVCNSGTWPFHISDSNAVSRCQGTVSSIVVEKGMQAFRRGSSSITRCS